MSASLSEVREHADALLELLRVRVKTGSLIIHIDDYRAVRCETTCMHRPLRGELAVDNGVTERQDS